MKAIHLALATGASVLAMASTASAVTTITLNEGSGWHYGESHSANSTAMFNYDGASGQFTLKAVVASANDYLSFVDGYVPGDVYAITIKALGGGGFTQKTQFLDDTYYAPIPNLTAGPFGSTFGPDWLNGAYGHFQAELSPGTYTITVKDLCGNRGNPACPGFPAGWGIRLDAAVPEPGTWGLMLIGFAGLGAALRGRKSVTA